jgi:hypothetical protein
MINFIYKLKYFFNQYIQIALITLLIMTCLLLYWKGKEVGYNEREIEYQKEIKIEQEIHVERVKKLDATLNKANNVKKNDYNNTNDLDNDFLLQAIE